MVGAIATRRRWRGPRPRWPRADAEGRADFERRRVQGQTPVDAGLHGERWNEVGRRAGLGCDSSKSVDSTGHRLAAPAPTATRTLKTGQVASGRKAFREIECSQALTAIGELWEKGRGCGRTPLMIGENVFHGVERAEKNAYPLLLLASPSVRLG